MRILILGSAGSGKSTLAKELAAKYSLPHIDLDTLYRGKRLPFETAWELLMPHYAQDSWIIEGAYLFEDLFRSATHIILLETNPFICLLRVWIRYFARRDYTTGIVRSLRNQFHLSRHIFKMNGDTPVKTYKHFRIYRAKELLSQFPEKETRVQDLL